jgi:hypothetical protein
MAGGKWIDPAPKPARVERLIRDEVEQRANLRVTAGRDRHFESPAAWGPGVFPGAGRAEWLPGPDEPDDEAPTPQAFTGDGDSVRPG